VTKVHVKQTNAFSRAYKKLHRNQKDAVDQSIKDIIREPSIGEAKKGNLAGVYVHKFECAHQRFLLAYEYDPATRVLLLVGTHENFYRKLKH